MAKDFSIFEKYAQEDLGMANPQDENGQDPEQDNPNVDPSQLQSGQNIYDNAGQEYTVLEQTSDGSGKHNIMPSDQQSQAIPTGVKQVDPQELSSSFTSKPMAKKKFSKKAQEEPYELNWGDFRDLINDMNQAVVKEDMQRLLEHAQDLIELIMMNIQMPSDTDVSRAFEKASCTKVHPAFRFVQAADVMSFEEPVPRFDQGKDQTENLTIGQGGFSKCMARLKELVAGKYETVDILLTIGEEFDRELANKVLVEARAQGIL